ncbi:uncharacterized protein LOC115727508 [Rhodamnia argentea]|uniref:Uncharacterized protein LOC115727508 n=1 Tax=Rhodamnia argentea TaxID=178133 RepID=A0A8B8MU21_9MYRT|nr:uncharacterized protein LOC115727508 [Rhodamnia argentea]
MMEKSNPRIRWDKSTYLHTSDMIKLAIRLAYRNPTFAVFSVLASLPLFLIMLTHELAIHCIFADASSRLRLVSSYSSQRLHIASGLIQETLVKFLQASLLYSVPALLLNLLTAVTTVHSSSTIFAEGRSACLLDMLKDSINKTRWKWPLITSTLVSFYSLVSWVCIVSWGGIGSFFASGKALHLSIWGLISVVAMAKWLEYRAVWDVAIVLSISEDKGVFEALSTASSITKGSRIRGCVLMLLNFTWWFGPAVLGFYVRRRCSAQSTYAVAVAVAEAGLVCAGKVVKWVVCVVYCHDCKRRSSRGKVVLEGGEGEHALLLRTVSS